jgi:hypothetical protein
MHGKGQVRLGRMFCPATDRNVPILFRHDGIEIDPGRWSTPGDPVHCLDYGFRCTGWLCPHFGSPDLPSQALIEWALDRERVQSGPGTRERTGILERALRENWMRESRASDGARETLSPY